MTTNTFIFNLEWYTVLLEYPAEVRFEVYEAIMVYASSGKLPELKPLAKMAFSFIKKELDYNRERYQSTVEKRRQAGSKGAEAKKAKRNKANASEAESDEQNRNVEAVRANASDAEQTKQTQAKQANASDAKQEKQKSATEANVSKPKQTEQTQAKQAYNDNVNDNDIINDNIFLERVNAGDEKIRDAYLNLFFGPDKQISLDRTIKNWETSRDELRQVCLEVLDDWTAQEQRSLSVDEAKRYFINAVRCKYQILKSQHYAKGKKATTGGNPGGLPRNGGAGQVRNALDGSRQPGFGLVD